MGKGFYQFRLFKRIIRRIDKEFKIKNKLFRIRNNK